MVGLIGSHCKPKMKTARIISPVTGKLIGGTAIEQYYGGEVVILFAGMRRRGMPLSNEDILALEAGTYKAPK